MEQIAERKDPLGVSVLTSLGVFPSDDDYRRAYADENIQKILDEVKTAQHITDTKDWVAKVDGRVIAPDKTFREEGLKCVIEIEWHKKEGGGGA
jgi:hypothetical protein